jgi:TolB-like protein/class 3 adenylate cyclase
MAVGVSLSFLDVNILVIARWSPGWNFVVTAPRQRPRLTGANRVRDRRVGKQTFDLLRRPAMLSAIGFTQLNDVTYTSLGTRPVRRIWMIETTAVAQLAASSQLARRMQAVLAADVVDYSRLMETAELETHVRLRALRVGTIDPCIVSHRGQIIKNTGDGFLASFDSTVDALRCAVEIQREIAAGEAAAPLGSRIRLRVGLNFGEVIRDQDDIYGTSVNVAARLEQFSAPGGIVISDAVRDMVTSRIEVSLEDLGQLELKNLSRPVQAYSLRLPGITNGAIHSSPAARRAKLPSIAVLPFRTLGAKPEEAYFGEGMVDDIIYALAGVRGLLVISRTSALAYRNEPVDLQRIGQELGVRYVLSGSVRRADRELRITAELADVETGSLIWVDRYDGELSGLFDLQERIATRIVWSLAPHLREAELKSARRKRPENMNAYELVLQGIELLYHMNPTDFARAGALLRQAIAADDNYATAYTYAALWQVHQINQGWTTNVEADSKEAARLAEAAVDRDPADGFALAIRGHTQAVLFRNYRGATEFFDRALKAAPGHAMAWTLSSGVYSYTGQAKTAIERAEMGLRLSPLDTQSFFYLLFLALAHYVNGTYDESIIWARKSAGLNPRLASNLRWLIASLVASGNLDEARQCAMALLEVNPRFRLSAYAGWCPLEPDLRRELLARLHSAGLPE